MTYHTKSTGLASMAALAVGALLAFAPMKAEAITITDPGLTEGGVTPLSINDIFVIEIFGDAADGGGQLAWGFQATEKLLAIETNSLNPNNGFADAMVEWNSAADGTGTSFGSISGTQLLMGGELETAFGINETKWLIASWSDVTTNGSNFDLRVTAVPLPASALLLMGGLGGLGGLSALRRRKHAA